MRYGTLKIWALATVAGSLIWPVAALSEKRAIDVEKSVLTIRVYKSGLFSAFAHNHEIEAPISQGTVEDSGSQAVQLRVDARKLRVLDPELSSDKRAEVQTTMEGPKVLDTNRYPEISFMSTSAKNTGADHWTVYGSLTLHGQTRPVIVDVTQKDGRYQGSATLKQSDFRITPVNIAGGTVRVKDEVKVEFDIVLVPKSNDLSVLSSGSEDTNASQIKDSVVEAS